MSIEIETAFVKGSKSLETQFTALDTWTHTVDGRTETWKAIRKIGGGGSGKVWEAWMKGGGVRAVKTIWKRPGYTEREMRAWEREIRSLMTLEKVHHAFPRIFPIFYAPQYSL